MFRPISGHPKLHNWSVKHVEAEAYMVRVRKTQLQLEPLSTHIVPVYDHKRLSNFNDLNCVVWTYIMHIFSSIYLKTNCEPEEDLR
jgi:hypothetical protein